MTLTPCALTSPKGSLVRILKAPAGTKTYKSLDPQGYGPMDPRALSPWAFAAPELLGRHRI